MIKREQARESEGGGGGDEDGGGGGRRRVRSSSSAVVTTVRACGRRGERALLPRGFSSCLPPRQQPAGPRLRGGCRFGTGAFEQGSVGAAGMR